MAVSEGPLARSPLRHACKSPAHLLPSESRIITHVNPERVRAPSPLLLAHMGATIAVEQVRGTTRAKRMPRERRRRQIGHAQETAKRRDEQACSERDWRHHPAICRHPANPSGAEAWYVPRDTRRRL